MFLVWLIGQVPPLPPRERTQQLTSQQQMLIVSSAKRSDLEIYRRRTVMSANSRYCGSFLHVWRPDFYPPPGEGAMSSCMHCISEMATVALACANVGRAKRVPLDRGFKMNTEKRAVCGCSARASSLSTLSISSLLSIAGDADSGISVADTHHDTAPPLFSVGGVVAWGSFVR